MKPFRWFLFAASLLVLGACERAKAPPSTQTAVPQPASPADSAAASAVRNWDSGAGPVLLVAGASPSRALVLTPDSAAADSQLAALPRPASVTLFGRGGTVQGAELPAITDSAGCAVGDLRAAPPPRPWSVGFIGGVVAPIAMDSAQSLTPADSLSLVASMNRLASAIPNDSAGRFAGLPFVVRSLWRFSIPSGSTVVVATLTRQINQEATPLQEHTIIVSERSPGDTALATVYAERSFGEEETIESRDVVAGVLIGPGHVPALLLSRDYGDATAYGLVERGGDGRWRARWRSARFRC